MGAPAMDVSETGTQPSDWFFGRRHELDALARCASAAASGTACTVLVCGEAGIGKTRLLSKAVAGLDPQFFVLRASCDQAERDWPFGVIDQWIRRVDPRTAPTLQALRGPRPEASPTEVGGTVLDWLGQQKDPVALVVDDAQWADAPSQQALRFLTRRLWADRVLLIITLRTEHAGIPEGWQRAAAQAATHEVLTVRGLSAAEVAEFASAVGDGAEVASRLYEHTGGHPLYVQSILESTTSDQRAGSQWVPQAPPSLASAVVRLLASLPEESRALVDAAAVLGDWAPLARLNRVAGVAAPVEALRDALASGLLEWSPADPTTPVRIRHQLQREAVYQALEPSRRRTLHAAAVRVADADHAWAHRVAAQDRTDPELARQLEEEAHRMRTGGRVDRAATLLQWAADLSADRSSYEREVLRAAYYLNAMPYRAGRRRFELSETVTGFTSSALRSCLLGRTAYARADFPQAERHYREALDRARQDQDPETEALVNVWLGGCLTYQAEHSREAIVCLHAALDSGHLEGIEQTEARYTLMLAHALSDGPAGGLRVYAEMPGEHEPLMLATAALLHVSSGDFTGAQEAAAAADSIGGTRIGLAVMYSLIAKAWSAYWTGAWGQAAAGAEQLIARAETEQLSMALADAHALSAMIAANRGRLADAAEHIAASRRWAAATSARWFEELPLLAEATLAHSRGDTPALVEAIANLPARPRGGRRLLDSWLLPLRAQAHVHEGQFEQAEAVVDQLEHLTRHCPWARLEAALAAGLLAQARHDTGRALKGYREALDQPPTHDDSPLTRAQIHHAAGRLLLADQQAKAAAVDLQTAHDEFKRLGATPYAQRAAQDLQASGATHHLEPSRTDSLQGLTEREETIARCVAEGLTNQEVGRELYISAKTVEYHLAHVYQKLGLTSRRQLRPLINA